MSDTVVLNVYRYDPSVDEGPTYVEYEVPWQDDGETDFMSIHQCLYYIYENLAQVAFDHNCGNGICGRCGVMVDGKPQLACWSKVEKGGTYTVEPLKGMPVVRDLIVDKQSNYDKFVDADIAVQSTKPMTKLVNIDYDLFFDTLHRFDTCRECMLCYASCTALNATATDLFVGPGAMMGIAMRHADPNDEADRIWQAVFSGGLFECVQCGNCTNVCPAGISVSDVIIAMKDEAKARGISSANSIMADSTIEMAKEIAGK